MIRLQSKFGLLLILLLVSALYAQNTTPEGDYHKHGKYSLPDPAVTPGSIDTNAVADLSKKRHVVKGIERNICAPDYSTAPIRKTIKNFPKLKKNACLDYNVKKCDGSVEGDHFIPIELGGCPDCQDNIWPQPMDEARIKDHRVEDVLGGPRGLVCKGEMSLVEARECVRDDWVACAKKLGFIFAGDISKETLAHVDRRVLWSVYHPSQTKN